MPRKLDGIYQEAVEFIHDTWKNNPFRIPILMLVALVTTTASLNLLYNPQTPAPTKISTAKANTYQFVPTSGSLVTGTEQNANSLLAAAAEGVNTGSWKGTLADDNFHWQVTAADSGTPNLNMQLDLGTAKLTNANKLVIQTEVDLDSASRTLLVQICDWVSSTSVDAAADSECTTGGWRSLNSQNASNADVAIALTTGAAFQWHIYDGYFTTGTTGGTAVSTPLTNFTSSDTQPIRIRYWSDADVVGTGDVAIDFLRANAFVDSIYHPAGAVNLNGSGGALAGTYANAIGIGNSATAQQSVTAGNAVYLTGAGTAGSVADFYLQFKNVKTYTGANTFYFKADYSCSAATAGLDHKFQIYNFATTTWTDLNSAVIACSTTDATHAWAENNITPADFIDESASDEVRVRFLGDLNSTTTLRIDFAYLILGSTNTNSAACELTWGAGTATNCTNTRDLIGPATPAVFSSGTAEEKSNTYNRDYYALDCPASVTAGECAAANIDFPVTVPSDAQVVVNHFAGKFAGDLVGTTNPDLTVQMGLRDYSGTPTSTSGPGGWTAVGATSATATQAYTDSITALAIGTYGMQINPDDHVDTVNNEMNIRLRSTVEGRSADDSRFEWDFAMVSIGWIVDSSHPTRNYQFAPTGDTLAAGTETARLGLTASATSGVNTGGWQATLTDDNLHWSVAGANVVGTNYDVQLNFSAAKQNGANKLLIQTEIDADANIALIAQICDWVSTTSVDNAADANCTGGGWRTLNSQNASNADVTYTDTASDALQWHIFDGYFTTGTTGGTAISTPLRYFFDATNGVKIRFFSTTQSSTNLDIDFLRIQPIIDSVYHPSGATNLNVSGGALAGTYANAHAVGNSATAQQSTTTADAVYLTGAGTAGSVADYYLSFTNIKSYTGANTLYFKADYSCSAATAGLDTEFAIYNFTSTAWEDLTSAAIACSTTDATHAWAKNNVTITDYINGGETRIRYYGDLNSTTTLRLDFAYLVVGSTNADTADCAITFGSGTATNCSNTRDLVGPGTATRFDNPAEDESATMGTGDSNSYHAFDNETTPDTTVEESTSSNISFPVTQPTNSSVVGQNYAARFSGCGNTGAACGAATLTTQLGFKDYSGFNAAVGGWLQVGGTSASSTLAYTDTITALGIAAYGHQISPEDYIDTANNKINLRLRTTTPGTSTSNVTTVWDFAMVSLQWIEIGSNIDIAGSSSVASSTVAVAVDGLLQVGKTATAAGGACPCAWSITSVFVAGDRPVLVWHDAASDANESSGITVYDGTSNISGMQLTAHTFSVGSGDDQNVDSADLIKFDNDADEDVMYKFVTTTLTVDATSTYTDDTIDILSGDTLTIGGSETMLTYNTTINGTLTSGGATTYTIQGDWINNGTFNESTSTVTMNGTTSEDMNSGCSNFDTCTAQNFYNLTINKTDAGAANDNLTLVTNHIRVTNTLTITDGELIQGTLNVRVEGASAVSVSANGTWTNISTGDLKLGGTFVNNGAVTFNSNNGTQCVDAADDIAISSTSGGSQRTWSGSGTETIYNVAVTDMADSSVTAYTSNFTNTTWTVGSCGIAITGSCDQYDQTTDCTDDGANQFRVAVNGSIQAQVDTTVDGTINITGVTAPSTGDIITVFIDGEATDDEEAVAVTKYDGTGDVTGIVLYWRHLSIGSGDNQSLANADIDAYDNSVSADEDIFFDVSAGDDLTVDTLGSYTDEELYIVTGNTYRPASAGGGDVNTTHLENDGTITADSNAINVFGSWQNDSTFTNGTSTVTFTSTTTGRTLSGTLTGTTGKFYNLIFNGAAGAWSFSAAVEASNDFQVSNGAVTASNNNLTVGRDFTLDNTAGVSYTAGSSSLNITRHFNDVGGTKFIEDTSTVNQTGTGTITVGTGGDFNNLSVGYTSFVTTFSNNAWDIFGNFTFNGGTVTGGGGYVNLLRSTTGTSVVFASATTLNGTLTIYHGTTGGGSFTYTIAGGNYGTWAIVPYASVNSVTFTLGGNVSTSTGFMRLEAGDGVTGSVFNTSGSNYSLSIDHLQIAPCAPTRTGSWAVDFNDSIVTLDNTTNSLHLGNNCGSHTLDLDTSDVTVNGSVEFVDGTSTVTVTPGTSDFTFAPAASQTETYASNAQSLWNMTINGADSAATIQPTSAVDVNNNFIITAGTYDTVSGSNYALTIGNNYSNSGTFTAQQGTVTFDATDTGNTLGGTLDSSSSFYNLTFDGNNGGWSNSSAMRATNNLTMTNGTLSGTNNVTVVGHVQGTSGVINLTGGIFKQGVNLASKNFGTTSGSAAWTFNDLTFANDSAICTGYTITTQTGGTGGITVAGILRVGESGDGAACTTTLNAGNRTWTLSGTGGDPFQILASPAGNLTPATSTFTYTGNNAGGDTTVQSETYNILIINNGSETFNLEGTTGAFSITITAGTLATGSNALSSSTSITVDGTLSGTGDVTLTTALSGTGTVNMAGGTTSITDGTGGNFGTTSGANNWTFNNLTMKENGDYSGMTVTTQTGGSGTITVAGILLVGDVGDGTGTTLNAGNRTWTLSGTGGNPFQLVGTAPNLVPSTSTFTYTGNNGGGDTTVQSETYHHLTLNNGSERYVLEAATSTDQDGDLTITAGTLDVGTPTPFTLTIGGSYSNSGNLDARSGTITFNSTASGKTLAGQMTGGSDDFNNLTFNGVGGAWTFNAAVEVGKDFTITNGSVTANGNNLTILEDFDLANTSGVSYVAGSTTVSVDNNWTDLGGKFSAGTSTVTLTGTGTLDHLSAFTFYNLNLAPTGFVTTLGTSKSTRVSNDATLNGGTLTGNSSTLEFPQTASNTPLTFNSPTTLNGTGFNIIGYGANSASITMTIGAGDYGNWNLFFFASANSVTHNFGGNVTTTAHSRLYAGGAVTGLTLNTQGHNFTTGSFRLGSGGSTQTVSANFGASAVTLTDTNDTIDTETTGGTYNLDLGSSMIDTKGNVLFAEGSGAITVTPGTSTLKWTHTSGTKTYTPNGQSLYNMELNASGGTVTPTATVDVNNNFTITAGIYDTVNGSNYALTIGGNYSNSGTFTARNANVTFDAIDAGNTLGGTMTGSSAFYTLTFNGSGGEWTPSAAVTVTDNLIMTNGSLLGTQDITVNKHVRGDNTGLINLTGGTFEQRVSANRDIGGSVTWTFNNLIFSNGGIGGSFTISTYSGHANNMNITGVLQIGKSGDSQSTTLDAGNRTWTLSGTGGDPFQILASPAGNLTPETSTFTFTGNNGSGNTRIQSETYHHIIFNNASETFYLEGTTSTDNGGDLTITAGTLTVSDGFTDYALNIGGSYSNSGNFDSASGTVTFTSTATGRTLAGQMTGASDDFYNLVFDGVAGDWTFNAAVDAANDFTVTNGAVVSSNNNLTVTRDFTLANTSGVSYSSGSSTVTVSRHWTDTGLKHVFGTSTVVLNGTGTVTAASSNSDFYNVSIAYSGHTTSLGDYIRLDTGGVITFNGGTVTNLGGHRIYLNSSTSNTPIVFASPTTIGSVPIMVNVNANGITVTVPAGNYGAADIAIAYRNNSTPTSATTQLGGNVTTTGTVHLGTQNSGNTSNFNTQGHSLTASGISFGSCLGFGCTNPVFVNFSTSTVDLGNGGLIVNNSAGSHTLDLGSSSITTTGNVKFVDGTGNITITPGSSTLTWDHTSGTKTYAPNGQSLWNMALNASGGTVQPTAAVDVNNNFTITAGTYDTVSGSNYALTVGGNFSNSGTFTAQNATVTLDGTAEQNVSGTLTSTSAFYNLTITNNSGTSATTCERDSFVPSVDFDSSVQINNNFVATTANTRIEYQDAGVYDFTNINWNGQASGTRIYFRNSATSGQWQLNVTGTQTAVSFVNVSRSDASAGGGDTIDASDGTNVDCTNNDNWNFGTPTFEQSAYRFANNENGTTVNYTGSPSQDSALTVAATGNAFRLRLLLHVGASNVAQNGETFKLQYGEKTAANCTTGVSWGDVSPSSGVIRFKDNATPGDGDNLTTNGGDPTHSGHTIVAQDYEEANNFTNSVAAINAGQDGLWDFSLENNSAPGGKRYCFKAVKSTGTDLDTYTSYPEVIIDEELVFSLDATSKNFGVVQPGDNPTEQSSTVTVTTNAATGYVVYAWSTQAMTKDTHTISDWAGTNASPTSFPNGSFGFGYSTDDSTLTGGTADRFTLGGAKYAGFTHSGPGDPVADRTSGPVSSQQNTITYRLAGPVGQQAGTYTTVVVYVVATTF